MKAIMKNLGYTVILLVIFGFNYVDNKQTVATESHSYISISYQLTDDRLLRAPRKIIICYSTQKVDVIEVTKTESIEDRIVSVLNAMSKSRTDKEPSHSSEQSMIERSMRKAFGNETYFLALHIAF